MHISHESQARTLARKWRLRAAILIGVLVALVWGYTRDGEVRLYLRMVDPVTDGQAVYQIEPHHMKISWRGKKKGTKYSNRFKVHPQVIDYRTPVPDMRRMNFTLTPSLSLGAEFDLYGFAIARPGYTRIQISDAAALLSSLEIEGLVPQRTGHGLRLKAVSLKQRIKFKSKEKYSRTKHFLAAALPVFFVLLATSAIIWQLIGVASKFDWNRLLRWENVEKWMSFACLVILTSVVALAASSHINQHPDEIWHIGAAAYYTHSQEPPDELGPATYGSISSYGASYLIPFNWYYWIAGKSLAFIEAINPDTPYVFMFREMRAVQCFMLAGLFVFFVYRKAWGFLVPFMITPQLWYVFSYSNNDAAGYTAAALLGYPLANRSSFLYRKPTTFDLGQAARFLIIVILLIAVFFSKTNFRILFPFFGIVYLVNSGLAKSAIGSCRRFLSRAKILSVTALLLVGAALTLVCLDKLANRSALDISPSQPGMELDGTLEKTYLRAKGVPLKDIFVKYDAIRTIASSFFATYGWMAIRHGDGFYRFVYGVTAILLAVILWIEWRHGSNESRWVGLAALCFFFMNLGAIVWWSWERDLQLQGRYLFPSLIGLSVYLQTATVALSRPFVGTLLAILFVAAYTSFLGGALAQVDYFPVTNFR